MNSIFFIFIYRNIDLWNCLILSAYGQWTWWSLFFFFFHLTFRLLYFSVCNFCRRINWELFTKNKWRKTRWYCKIVRRHLHLTLFFLSTDNTQKRLNSKDIITKCCFPYLKWDVVHIICTMCTCDTCNIL